MIPRSLIWLVTANCNLNCLHCYTSRFKAHYELNTTETINIIKEAYDIGVSHISLTGGEPLIRKDINTIISEIYNHGMSISLVTNATIIKENLARMLYMNEVFTYVSIDGSNARTHNLIRGESSWNKTMKGISYLKREGVTFSTVLALNKLNMYEVREYIMLAKDIGAWSACIIPVMPTGRAKINIMPSPSDLFKVIKLVDEVSKDVGYKVSIWCYKPAELILSSKYIRVYGCRTYGVVDMDPSGKLLICDILDFKVADVRKLGLKRALEVYERNELIKSLVFPNLTHEPCKSCQIRDTCRGGCFARAYLLLKDIHSPDPYCPLFTQKPKSMQDQ